MSEPDSPRHKPADREAGAIRERALGLLADAAVHVQRIGSAAEKLGLTPDLVDGLGDDLYEAAVAQLDVVSKILERSQTIADRLIELGTKRFEASRFNRLDVTQGKPAHLRFVVHNSSARSADVTVRPEWDGEGPLSLRIGRSPLPAGRETSVEIPIPTALLVAGRVYAGTARIWLTNDAPQRIELPRYDFEIWVNEHEQ